MAIKFETFDMPNATCEQEVSPEQEKKIAKRLAKADASLRKKMKRIARTEAEAWKKSRNRGVCKPPGLFILREGLKNGL